MSISSSDREERFRGIYAANFDALLGYALRRVDRPEDAADIVSDAFLVAWRRLSEVPAGEDARLWLYGVARRTLANHRRGNRRRIALGERLGQELATVVPDHCHAVVEREAVAAALARLADRDREVLELAAWEGLQPREIAQVLGISDIAVRSRLSRSRARLRKLVGNETPASGHDQDVPTNHVSTEEGR